MTRLILALATLIAALSAPALAQPALTAEEFEARTEGRTVTWSFGPNLWGIEEYLPGRRVQWASTPTECQIGHWYPQGEAICFRYDTNPKPACWIFRDGETGLTAELFGDAQGLTLHQSDISAQGLPCPGPELGV